MHARPLPLAASAPPRFLRRYLVTICGAALALMVATGLGVELVRSLQQGQGAVGRDGDTHAAGWHTHPVDRPSPFSGPVALAQPRQQSATDRWLEEMYGRGPSTAGPRLSTAP